MNSLGRDLEREERASSYRHLLIIGAAIGLMLLLFTFVRTVQTTETERRAADEWYIHTLQVLVATGDLDSAVQRSLHAERGYLLTAQPQYQRQFEADCRAVSHLADQVAQLTHDNPNQRRNVAQFRRGADDFLALLSNTMKLSAAGDRQAALKVVRDGIATDHLQRLQRLLDQMDREERRLLVERNAHREAAASRMWGDEHILSLAAAGFLLLAAFGLRAAARARRRIFALTKELDRVGHTDRLTGLPNRRSFEQTLIEQIARTLIQKEHRLCLTTLDVDFFKQVNDRYGHLGGDEVLRAVASTLRGAIREGDTVARTGGEEFAVIMPGAGLHDAENAAERIRASVERQRIELSSGPSLSVTVSLGTAAYVEGETWEDFCRRADQALYDAKAAGRNVVKLAPRLRA